MPSRQVRYIGNNMNTRSNISKVTLSFFLLFLLLGFTTFALAEENQEETEEKKKHEVADSRSPGAAKSVQNVKVPDEQKSDQPSEPTAAEQAMKFLLERNYAPPLSLFESIRLTDNVIMLLDNSLDKFKGPRREKALQLLSFIKNYVKLTDDRASSLLFYRWYYIGKHRVEGATIEEETFTPRPLVKNVSAVSFEALNADIFIHYMKVIGVNDHVVDFKINKWIYDGLPRKEVCFLYFPTTVKKIIIDYATKPETKARLKVYVGVTDHPEHGKAALYYLSHARKNVEQDAFDKALEDLQKAKELLIKFQRQQRL